MIPGFSGIGARVFHARPFITRAPQAIALSLLSRILSLTALISLSAVRRFFAKACDESPRYAPRLEVWHRGSSRVIHQSLSKKRSQWVSRRFGCTDSWTLGRENKSGAEQRRILRHKQQL